MAKKVLVIPTSRTNEKHLSVPEEGKKKRVAAYCRVSTEHEDQLGSVENQAKYYEQYIRNHPQYELYKIYRDDGISGTEVRKRGDFLEMIEDCENGKIDLILTKSISRFARNTEECLRYSRKLKELKIPIIFEKENVNTMEASGELLFTILSSLAQEESRNISENTAWGIRSLFRKGIPHLNTNGLLGYDKTADGTIVINPAQAEIVHRIYSEYLDGWQPADIAQHLNDDKVPGVHGEPRWNWITILYILQNEIYKGDLRMQKTYTVDFLRKKEKKNTGELEQFYVRGNHTAIIDTDTWEAVQLEIMRRNAFRANNHITKQSVKYADPLYARIFCGSCGGKMCLWNAGKKKSFWKCKNAEAKNGKFCSTSKIPDALIQQAIIAAWNDIISGRDTYIPRWTDLQQHGNALERLRAAQMEALTSMEPINCVVSELVRLVVHKIIVNSGNTFTITFMDGTEKSITVKT